MTYTARSSVARKAQTDGWNWVTAILAALGVVGAGIGLWIALAPDTGTLSLFGWEWAVAEISEFWAPALLITGGLVASISMGFESVRDWADAHNNWQVAFESLVTLAGIAAAVIGIILLF